LYFSEIAHYEPCYFCWIQRYLLYPESLICGLFLLKPNILWFRRIAIAPRRVRHTGVDVSLSHRAISEPSVPPPAQPARCVVSGVWLRHPVAHGAYVGGDHMHFDVAHARVNACARTLDMIGLFERPSQLVIPEAQRAVGHVR
jgi:hypothetical protein